MDLFAVSPTWLRALRLTSKVLLRGTPQVSCSPRTKALARGSINPKTRISTMRVSVRGRGGGIHCVCKALVGFLLRCCESFQVATRVCLVGTISPLMHLDTGRGEDPNDRSPCRPHRRICPHSTGVPGTRCVQELLHVAFSFSKSAPVPQESPHLAAPH